MVKAAPSKYKELPPHRNPNSTAASNGRKMACKLRSHCWPCDEVSLSFGVTWTRGSRIVNRIHIIGRKNHGKTTLIVELVEELTSRGLRVGTIKHTHHRHELDIPGKDSHRHRTAGAAVVGVWSRSMSAIFLPAHDRPSGEDDQYAVFGTAFDDCRIVLVEGDQHATAAKIEMWRSELATPPLATQDPSILAIVSNDAPPCAVRVHPRADVAGLTNWILDNFVDGRIG